MSEEVADPDGPPVRLTARRESRGVPRQPGARGRSRRAPPAPRRVSGVRQERGLRPSLPLPWLKFGVDGAILEMASAARKSRMRNLVHLAYPAHEHGGSCGHGWGRNSARRFSPPHGRPDQRRRPRSSRCMPPAIGRRCLRAPSTAPTVQPAFDQHAGCRRRRLDRHQTAWLRPSNDKAPRLEAEADRLWLSLCSHSQADHEPGGAGLHPHHRVHRAVHGAHPSDDNYNSHRCSFRSTMRTVCSTGSPGGTTMSLIRTAASLLSRRGRRRSRRRVPKASERQQWLSPRQGQE